MKYLITPAEAASHPEKAMNAETQRRKAAENQSCGLDLTSCWPAQLLKSDDPSSHGIPPLRLCVSPFKDVHDGNLGFTLPLRTDTIARNPTESLSDAA